MQNKDCLPTTEQLIRSIRIIKGQRQRANLPRIFKSLKNHHDINSFKDKAVVELLEEAVTNGILTKIHKKGEVAYQEYVQALPKTRQGPKKPQLYSAIQEVIVEHNDGQGLSLKTICEEMKEKELCHGMNPVLLKYTVKICCLRMVTRELLVREGVFFRLGPYSCLNGEGGIRIQDDEEVTPTIDRAISNKRPASPMNVCGLCLGDKKKKKMKKKKMKRIDDDDDEEINIEDEEEDEEEEDEEEEEELEKLISCVECGRSGHPSCLKFSHTLAANVAASTGWQCVDCKRCSICGRSDQADSMLFCDTCDRGFHMTCCNPVIRKPPKGVWTCLLCQQPTRQKTKRTLLKVNKPPFPFRRSSSTKTSFRKYIRKKHYIRGFKTRSTHIIEDNTSKAFKRVVKEMEQISVEEKEHFKRCQVTVVKMLQEVNAANNHLPRNHQDETNGNTRVHDDDDKDGGDGNDATILVDNVGDNDKPCNGVNNLKCKEGGDDDDDGVEVVGGDDNDGGVVKVGDNGGVDGGMELVMGRYKVKTWYSSVYPPYFKKHGLLFICEICLNVMESQRVLSRHQTKCQIPHPPGVEIYREGQHSVFEVDGNTNKSYAQNICFLAKLFLDHKTLHYDVEPFIFYVLTHNTPAGCHFVGYFSKEKYNQQKYNLSCIMVLPQHQRKGFGSFLIDFSYLLSRQQGCTGSPEKPLSDLGLFSYQCYWSLAVADVLLLIYNKQHQQSTTHQEALTVKNISVLTGMNQQDVCDTLSHMKLLFYKNKKLSIRVRKCELERWASRRRWKADVKLLIWKPLSHSSLLPYNLEEDDKGGNGDDEGGDDDGSECVDVKNVSIDSSDIECDADGKNNRNNKNNLIVDNLTLEDGPLNTSTPMMKRKNVLTGDDEDDDGGGDVGGGHDVRSGDEDRIIKERPSLFDVITPIKNMSVADVIEDFPSDISHHHDNDGGGDGNVIRSNDDDDKNNFENTFLCDIENIVKNYEEYRYEVEDDDVNDDDGDDKVQCKLTTT